MVQVGAPFSDPARCRAVEKQKPAEKRRIFPAWTFDRIRLSAILLLLGEKHDRMKGLALA